MALKVFIGSTLISGIIMFVATLFLGPFDIILDGIIAISTGLVVGLC